MNRRASMSWENTRDTAVVIESLLELLKAGQNSADPPTFEVWLDGELVRTIDGNASGEQPVHRLALNAWEILSGVHKLEIRRLSGPDFEIMLVSREFATAAEAPNVDDARPLMIERRFYKTNPLLPSTITDRNAAGQQSEQTRRMPLTEQDTIKAGDVIEVELTVTTREDLQLFNCGLRGWVAVRSCVLSAKSAVHTAFKHPCRSLFCLNEFCRKNSVLRFADLVSLVRFAVEQQPLLAPFADSVSERFSE